MFRYRKLFLIFLAASFISGQDFLSDSFFLDLGIVIEPKTGNETNSKVVEEFPRDNAVVTVNKTHGKAVYMATTSEMFASLDRINEQIRSTEEMLKSKITSLEQENLGLKNQIMDLNQRMEYEFPNILVSEGISSKPPIENPVPLAITALSDSAIEDLPTDIGPDHNGKGPTNKSGGFDQAKYTIGVIAYQREDYELCLEIFNQLPLDQTNQRTMSNILYWMADAYQQLRDYDKALMMLERLSISGSKEQMDDMLVKKAFIYREQGSQNQAKEVFAQLVDLFPESEYAPLAQIEIKNYSSEQ